MSAKKVSNTTDNLKKNKHKKIKQIMHSRQKLENYDYTQAEIDKINSSAAPDFA